MQDSAIEWTDHTFNVWRGCTKVSPGCDHCYAETLGKRNPGNLGLWGRDGTRPVGVEAYWKLPVKWNRAAEAAGVRKRVFCLSLGDVFEGPETMPAEAVASIEDARQRLFDLVDATHWLDWIMLTKRPENIRRFWPGGYRPNVWLLTSVENQTWADRRCRHLIGCRDLTPILGYSAEPLLGPIDAMPLDGIGWCIVGGESGGGARPMDPTWVRSIRDQCVAAGVPLHFKQWGKPMNNPHIEVDLTVKGKGKPGTAKGGRMLDGRTWDELPQVVYA